MSVARRVNLAALILVAVSGCGEGSSYELRWTIDCQPGEGACEPTSVKGCSAVGLDSVEVLALQGGDLFTAIFPCFTPGEGPVGRGPDLEPGSVDLEVYGLSPGGLRLTDIVRRSAVIPESGRVEVQVNLPRPAQCRDGVDNDDDGLVDLLDPGCSDSQDADESS